MRVGAGRFMTAPAIASRPVRLCSRDGFAMVLDVETARLSIEAGWPAVELWTCRMGHSHRVWPVDELAARRAERKGRRPCAVCGLWLPFKSGLRGQGGRQVHEGACMRFKYRAYQAFRQAHPGTPFFLDEQSWYKGIHAPLSSPPLPLDPLAGHMPKDWAEGWASVHGYETGASAA